MLEALSQKWSNIHLFKCNCSDKCASCVHILLACMVCDPSIKVPNKNLGITIQRRRGRGRPSRKGCEVGDAGEARARACIVLQKEYIQGDMSALVQCGVRLIIPICRPASALK